MAINNNTVFMNDSTRSMTGYEKFKGDIKNLGESIRLATNRSLGYNSDFRPVQSLVDNFVNQWAKPAVNDAKSLVESSIQNVVPEFEFKPVSFDQAIDSVKDKFSPAFGASGPSYSSVQPADNSGRSIDYVNADLAKHYGMDQKAAYSEALQNTAYQRAVSDLKAAGLNPVLAASGFAPAGSYAAGDTLSAGSGSGSSGGYGYGSSAKYAFSSEDYNLIGITGTIVGALVGAKVSRGAPVLGASTGAMLGKQVTQSLAQALSSANSK